MEGGLCKWTSSSPVVLGKYLEAVGVCILHVPHKAAKVHKGYNGKGEAPP